MNLPVVNLDHRRTPSYNRRSTLNIPVSKKGSRPMIHRAERTRMTRTTADDRSWIMISSQGSTADTIYCPPHGQIQTAGYLDEVSSWKPGLEWSDLMSKLMSHSWQTSLRKLIVNSSKNLSIFIDYISAHFWNILEKKLLKWIWFADILKSQAQKKKLPKKLKKKNQKSQKYGYHHQIWQQHRWRNDLELR